MKRLLFILIAVLVLCAENALAEWVRSTSTDTSVGYHDPTTIRRTGTFAKMWSLTDYSVAKTNDRRINYFSEQTQFEYDCSEIRFRITAYVENSGQMGTGTVVGSANASGSWNAVVPNSVGQIRFRIACGISTPTADASNADFDLLNNSSESILFVYVSPIEATSWGEDKLGAGVVVDPGNRMTIRMPKDGQCQFDVRVGYKDRRFEERRGQNLCTLTDIVFNGSTLRTSPVVTAPQAPRSPSAAPPAGGQSFGTGFFVSPQGHALTNNHVTQTCKSIVALLDGRTHPAQLVRRDERNDLAMIRVQVTGSVPFVRFRSAPGIKAGEGVMVAGFPLPDVLQNGLNVTLGNVSALAGLGGNTAFLQVTAPVQPGNSGGPLLDMGGNLVGVVVSKLDAMRIAQSTGDIPQNINFAVQGAMARLFLEAGGQRVEERSSAKELRIGDVSDLARQFTFQIECRQ